MLIDSHRLTDDDRARWAAFAPVDGRRALARDFRRHIARAEAAITAFFAKDASGYCGVSWGKDSVVVAGLLMHVRPQTPLVWVRVIPNDNPDCAAVRDAFLGRFPAANYSEVETRTSDDRPDGVDAVVHCHRAGFARAAAIHGARHVSGVRGEESSDRGRRMLVHGETSINTCAPIGWWTGKDVFAYLHAHDLPVHPAYAMSGGGTMDRGRIRVAAIGGQRGTGMGRAEWERRYYGGEPLAPPE